MSEQSIIQDAPNPLVVPESGDVFSKAGVTNEYCLEVVKMIGADISPKRIAELIVNANDRGFAFHGVKGVVNGEISEVRPVTPEGGGVSYWATGAHLFGDPKAGPGTLSFAYNSPFFHWGHCFRDDNNSSMRIVLINRDNIKMGGNRITPNQAEVTFDSPIPKEDFMIIEIDVPINAGLTPRGNSQKAEHAMFNSLEQVVVGNGFRPGYKLKSDGNKMEFMQNVQGLVH